MSGVTQVSFGMVNAFLIRGQGAVWVDTGVLPAGECYRDVFARLSVSPDIVDLIILTHAHTDHFAHINELKALTGAPVACQRSALPWLRSGTNAPVVPCNALGRNVWSHIQGNVPAVDGVVEPDVLVDQAMNLNPYGISGQVVSTPGHTACSLSVLLEDGAAIIGDMLVASPLNGKACMAYFAVDETALFSSVRSLLPGSRLFYSGHGGPFTRAEIEILL